MANRQVRLTPKARDDLEEIWSYTATTWSVEQAERYTDQIIDAFDALATTPERAVDVGDLRDGYFRWSIGRHYIFFRNWTMHSKLSAYCIKAVITNATSQPASATAAHPRPYRQHRFDNPLLQVRSAPDA